jgi:hypothetical protein
MKKYLTWTVVVIIAFLIIKAVLKKDDCPPEDLKESYASLMDSYEAFNLEFETSAIFDGNALEPFIDDMMFEANQVKNIEVPKCLFQLRGRMHAVMLPKLNFTMSRMAGATNTILQQYNDMYKDNLPAFNAENRRIQLCMPDCE